jgi:hypothetical protein
MMKQHGKYGDRAQSIDIRPIIQFAQEPSLEAGMKARNSGCSLRQTLGDK